MSPVSPVIYYITAHGYGHGVRSCDILRTFARRYPERPLLLVTDLPESFLRNRLPGVQMQVRQASFDVGMVQLDSIKVDVDATLERVAELMRHREQRVADETRWLEEQQPALVQCDIPSIPLEAAARLDLPRLAISNFSWDWIYSPFVERDARWTEHIASFEEGYRQADFLMRLPFAGDMSVFPKAVDVPLVAQPGIPRRADLARTYGLPLDKTWALLSFSTLDLPPGALREMSSNPDLCFLTVKPLEWSVPGFYAIDRRQFTFSDVLASCDVVVTKPGFGVVSECIVNNKPICYADRSDFIEYPILVRGIEQYLQHAHLPSQELYRGVVSEYVRACLQAPPPVDHLPAQGDEVVCDLMHRHLSTSRIC